MGTDPARTGNTDVERAGGQPAEQLAALLLRAENGDQAAPLLAGVGSALMHFCGLQSSRHAKGAPRPLNRRTYQHSFLLPDGNVRVLWELEHDTGPEPVVRYAVFTEREDLAVAEWEADTAFGGTPSCGPAGPPGRGGPLAREGAAAPGPGLGPDPVGLDDPVPPGPAGRRRSYTEHNSPDHAFRLLRRAANPNPPGEDVRLRLRAAAAHTISIVTRRSAVVAGRPVSWTLYEHAFLLVDGSEVSLWEIDHTRTPGGIPVCEVYASRDAALDTAVRRIEAG